MLIQLNGSLDIFNHMKEDSPPVHAPYTADTRQTAAIFENGFEMGLYKGRNFAWIQLHPFQMVKEVRIKNRLAESSSKNEYRL